MRKRKLTPGPYVYETADLEVDDFEKAVHLTIITKAPEKYLVIDLETGQMYRGSSVDNKHVPGYKLWKLVKK